jgi:hypothetical protein
MREGVYSLETIASLHTIDHEMGNASLELLNQLSRFRDASPPGPSSIATSDRSMFGERSLAELTRDQKFFHHCIFLAGTALVLAWCAQALRYFGYDALPMFTAALTASVFVPITFGVSLFPVYPVWVQLLRRRPGGLVALASIFCLCWSLAELVLGAPLP